MSNVSLHSGTIAMPYPKNDPDTKPLSFRSRIGVAWFYTSQILSVIGLAGILDDLKSWVKFSSWVLGQIELFSPDLSAALVWCGRMVRIATAAWRTLLHPVVDFLLDWLPFSIPILLKDILLVAIFLMVALPRTIAWVDKLTDKLWPKARRIENLRFQELAGLYGVSNESCAHLGVEDAYFYAWNFKRDRARLRAYQRHALNRFEAVVGDRAVAFAIAVVEASVITKARKSVVRIIRQDFFLKRVLRAIVFFLATFVSSFIALDTLLPNHL